MSITRWTHETDQTDTKSQRAYRDYSTTAAQISVGRSCVYHFRGHVTTYSCAELLYFNVPHLYVNSIHYIYNTYRMYMLSLPKQPDDYIHRDRFLWWIIVYRTRRYNCIAIVRYIVSSIYFKRISKSENRGDP